MEWLGGSDSELGVFIIPLIFPIQWGAVWSYLEFPNHLILTDMSFFARSIPGVS